MLAGFGWAKPVPVNPYYFTKIRNRKAGIALTALAGPVSNLLMALVAMLIAKGLLLLPVSGTAVSFLFTIFLVVCQTNLGLAVFNLIPHPTRWTARACWNTSCRPGRWTGLRSTSR